MARYPLLIALIATCLLLSMNTLAAPRFFPSAGRSESGGMSLRPSARARYARLQAADSWEMSTRAFPNGIDPFARLHAIEQMEAMEQMQAMEQSGNSGALLAETADLSLAAALHAHRQNGIPGFYWSPIGPAPITGGQTYSNGSRVDVSGRTSAIVVNPANPDEVYLGTAAGGVWHSISGGQNWVPLSDNEASLAIGALALDQCTGQGCTRVYAGTGENAIRRDTYYGMGLLVGERASPEGPIYWQMRGTDIFAYGSINNVLLDPTTSGSSKRLYVTLSSGVTASASESTVTAPEPAQGYGIFKSEDNALSFRKLTIPGSEDARPTDLEMDPQNSSVLYAGFLERGIFKSTDGGTSWCPLNPGIPVPGCTAAGGLPNPASTPFDHVEITIHRPGNEPAILYAIFGDCPNPILTSCNPSIYKSVDDGTSWTEQTSSAPGSYSRYTHVLTIHPQDPTIIYFGGLKLWKSTDSGQSFTSIGSETLHPDHHALVFPDPSDPERMYNSSDGGFAYSSDGGQSWNSGNSTLQITGFQSISTSPKTDAVIGGSQDNGTNLWQGGYSWEHRDDGDSASTIMHRQFPLVMYDVYHDLVPRRSKNGGNCCSWPSITNGLVASDPSAFYPPFVQDPSLSPAPKSDVLWVHRLYFGTNRLYLSENDGDSWSPISPVLGGTTEVFTDINRSNVITAIAVSPSDPTRIYVGYYDGQIWRSNANGACNNLSCWTNVSTRQGLPRAVVTRIAVHPTDPDTAYATFSGFNIGAHVYKTTTGGVSWTAANGSGRGTTLPDIPANTITIIPGPPETLLLGTDIGIFYSTDGGDSWLPFNAKLPRVPVYEIAYDETRDRVFAATHGRGAYTLTSLQIEGLSKHLWTACPVFPCQLELFLHVMAVINPAEDICTIEIIQQDGNVCARGQVDAQGGRILTDASGQLITTREGFYSARPVAALCAGGSCVGGVPSTACMQANNPIEGARLTCGDHVTNLATPRYEGQSNPPSAVLALAGLTGGPAPASDQAGGSFELAATLQTAEGGRTLCRVTVDYQRDETNEQVLARAARALNMEPACAGHGLRATLQPTAGKGREDEPPPAARLELEASTLQGLQLIPAIHAGAGQATGLQFGLEGLGLPMLNSVMASTLRFHTPPEGAAGGMLKVTERSSLGSCTLTIPIPRGSRAGDIAALVVEAFHQPGSVDPSCHERHNPRDLLLHGDAVLARMASQLIVESMDESVGLEMAPVGLRLSPAPLYLPVVQRR